MKLVHASADFCGETSSPNHSGGSTLLFRHVFPVSYRHVLLVLLGVETFLYADGLEIGSPQFLKQFVVVGKQVFMQFPVAEVKRQSLVFRKFNTDGTVLGGSVKKISVQSPGIKNKPRLVGESVMKMGNYQRKHIMVRSDDPEISSVFCLLETQKLHHAQTLEPYFS